MNKSKILRVFTSIPELETPRLKLRRIKPADYADMYEYSKLEDVTRFLLWNPHSDIEYTRLYVNNLQMQYKDGDFYDWAVVYKPNMKMIGTCGFTSFNIADSRAEIGYVLNPQYWGKGLAAEAAERVIRFGFDELNVNRIEARYMSGNFRSRRVMEKCGMIYEGTYRSYMYVKDEYKDIGICSILRSEYLNRKYSR